MSKEKCEKIVFDETVEMLEDPDTVSRITEELTEMCKEEDPSYSIIQAFENEKMDLKQKLKNLLQALENGVTSTRITERIPQLEA